jgi:hypothetical protein
MAIPQRGRNSGLTGVIDVYGTPKFNANITTFTETVGVSSVPLAGRGDSTPWVPSYPINAGGQLVAIGNVQFRQPPLPGQFRGQEGSITLQFHEAAKQTLSVRVDNAQLSLAKDSEDLWKIVLTCTILTDPTQAGWNSEAPSATAPTAVSKETFAGLSKSIDPLGLQSNATRTFFLAPLNNSDAAETTAITAAISAAVAPFPGAKVRLARLEANRTFDTAVFLIAFGHTTTEEDVVNPATYTTTDSNKLQSQASAAGVFSSPSDPGGDFVLVTSTMTEIHDGATKTVNTYALLDSKQSVEFPGTVTKDDVSNLEDAATVLIVHSSATVPADPAVPLGVLVARETVQINRVRWQTVWSYANSTTAQRLIFPKSPISDDPKDLEDTDEQSVITTSSTLPSDPATRIAGLKIRRRASVRLTGTPEQWNHTFYFARRDTEDDVEMDGSSYDVDPSSLQDRASVSVVEADSTPDGGVTVSGLVLHHTTKKQLHDSKWEITYHFQQTTTEEDVTYPGTITIADPSALVNEARITLVNSSANYPIGLDTPPAGLKLRSVRTERLTDAGKYKHLAEYGRRSNEDDVEQGGTSYDVDESALRGTAKVTIVEADATPDGGVTVSGMILRNVSKKQIHDSKWEITYEFAATTSEQDETYPGTVTIVDPTKSLVDEATVTLVNSSSTYPSALDTPPTGLKLRNIRSRRLTNAGKWKHTAEYGRRDTEDDIEMDGSSITDDASNLSDEQYLTTVTSSATPAPGAVPTDHVLRSTTTHQLHDSRWKHRFHYTRNTGEQDVEFDGSHIVDDESDLDHEVLVTEIQNAATPTPPSVPGTPANLQLISTRTRQLTALPAPGRWKYTFVYGLVTNKQKIEYRGSKAIFDPFDDIDAVVAEVVDTTDSLITLAAADRATFAGDAAHARSEFERLNPAKVLRTRYSRSEVQLVRLRTTSGFESVDCIFDGANVKVRVGSVVKISNTVWRVEVVPITRWICVIDFTLSYLTDDDNKAFPFGLMVPPSRNNADFIGFPQYYVAYVGCETEFNRAITDPLYKAVHRFRFSSAGHFSPGSVRTGTYDTDVDCTGMANSYQNASVFGWGDGGGFSLGGFNTTLP